MLVERTGHLLAAAPAGLGLGQIVGVFLVEVLPVAHVVEQPPQDGRPPRLPGSGRRTGIPQGHEPLERRHAPLGCLRQLPAVS